MPFTDFGLSNCAGILGYSDPFSTQCGSPAYAAPELLARKKYGPKIDVWSMWVTSGVYNCYCKEQGHLQLDQEPPSAWPEMFSEMGHQPCSSCQTLEMKYSLQNLHSSLFLIIWVSFSACFLSVGWTCMPCWLEHCPSLWSHSAWEPYTKKWWTKKWTPFPPSSPQVIQGECWDPVGAWDYGSWAMLLTCANWEKFLFFILASERPAGVDVAEFLLLWLLEKHQDVLNMREGANLWNYVDLLL